MAGKKGRSGRKTNRDEQKRLDVIDKAWNIVDTTLDDTKNTKRFDIAKDIVLKDITQHIKGEGFDSKQYLQAFQHYTIGDIRGIVEALRKGISKERPTLDDRGKWLPEDKD